MHWPPRSYPDQANRSVMPPTRTKRSNPAAHPVSGGGDSRLHLPWVALQPESVRDSVAAGCCHPAQRRNGRRLAVVASHTVSEPVRSPIALPARHLPSAHARWLRLRTGLAGWLLLPRALLDVL